MVKQYRPPVGLNLWEFPGGACDTPDDQETFIHDAVRELAEETGIIISSDLYTKLGSLHPLPGSANVTTTYYVVMLDDQLEQPVGIPQAGEIDELAWLPIENVLNSPDHLGAASMLVLAKYKGLLYF